jgi:hypothetical protein
MNVETWLVLSVAAAFLLLGIAGSPLAWVALQHRKSHLENLMEKRWNQLAAELRRLEGRLALAEEAGQSARGKPELVSSEHGSASNGRSLPNRPFLSTWRRLPEACAPPQDDGRSLISVPNLAAASEDRDASSNSLSQRYSAIWTLADQGAAPDVIAKATGQPIGQIELILGLRRHIDGSSRTTIPHAPHA